MRRHISIGLIGDVYFIECLLNGRLIHKWKTRNELTQALITVLWLAYGHEEPLMNQLVKDIL